MATIVIENSQPEKILQHAVLADPSAFYAGAHEHAVTGGRLTVNVIDGRVVISSNKLDASELKQLFSDFLIKNEETK